MDHSDEANVVDIYHHNAGKKKADSASYMQYIQWITDSLAKSPIEYSLKDFSWNTTTEMVNVNLIDQDREIDVFGSGQDLWKLGKNFTFDSFRVDYAPFFERLICSNGNIAREYGSRFSVNQNRFNDTRIKSLIEKNIMKASEETPILLMDAAQHLQSTNISIAEFQQFKQFFESKNEDEKYERLIGKYFSEVPFYTAYGDNLEQKSKKWKSTANSGILAYDFFNMLTYLASHPDEIKMDKVDRTELQIKASTLLFKKELDLEDVAAAVNFNYPKLAIMN